MLEVHDLHRIQIIQNLKFTMKHAESIFSEMGILPDFQTIVRAIENPTDQNLNNPNLMQNEAAIQFKLGLTNEEQIDALSKIKTQPLYAWIPVINDLEPHFQYADNLSKFKLDYKPWIEIHIEIVGKRLVSPELVTEKEKNVLNIDITTLSTKMS